MKIEVYKYSEEADEKNKSHFDQNKEEWEKMKLRLESSKYAERDNNLGEGLRFNLTVQLSAEEYRQTTTYDACGTIMVGGEYDSLDRDFENIAELVEDIRKATKILKRSHFGAKIKPIFYTVEDFEENWDDKEWGGIKEVISEAKKDEDLEEGSPDMFLQLADYLLKKGKIIVRGLNEQERADFKRLWNQ